MNATARLKTLERESFKTLFYDGLIDIGLGLWLMIWSALIVAGNAALGGIGMVVMLPFWHRARERFSMPRMGEVRLQKKARFSRVAWIIGALTLTMALGIFLAVTRGSLPRGLEDSISANPHYLLGGVLAFLLACLGAVFRVGRLYAYGLLVMGAFVIGPRIGIEFPYSMTLAGGLVLIWGVAVLIGFIQANPVVEPIDIGNSADE